MSTAQPETGAQPISPAAAREPIRPPVSAFRKYFLHRPTKEELVSGLLEMTLGPAVLFGLMTIGLMIIISAANTFPEAAAGQDPGGTLALFAFAILLNAVLFFLGVGFGWKFLSSGLSHVYLYVRQKWARSGAVSDEEIDYWLNAGLKWIFNHGQAQIDVGAEPIRIHPLWAAGPALPADYTIGLDGKVRFASYEAAVIVLTDHRIGAYTCVLNMLTGEAQLAASHEFMLADVVSVATINGGMPTGGGATSGALLRSDGPIRYNHVQPGDISVCQQLRISLTSGDAVTVNIGLHVNGTELADEERRTYVVQTVRALRATLRDLKGGPDA